MVCAWCRTHFYRGLVSGVYCFHISDFDISSPSFVKFVANILVSCFRFFSRIFTFFVPYGLTRLVCMRQVYSDLAVLNV